MIDDVSSNLIMRNLYNHTRVFYTIAAVLLATACAAEDSHSHVLWVAGRVQTDHCVRYQNANSSSWMQ